MGYKYAIWLTYDDNLVDTQSNHISHFTIACMLEKQEAIDMYKELRHYLPESKTEIQLLPTKQHFETTFYKNDTTGLYAWGFIGSHPKWDIFRRVSEKYNGSFSYTPHTSVEYSSKPFEMNTKSDATHETVQCTLHTANASSDNYEDWYLLC